MNLAGEFNLFADAFPTGLLPEVFSVVIEEWPNSPRPEGKPLENRITNRFVGHLSNAMRRKHRPCFKFRCRPKLADADSDSESGEVDMLIDSFSPHPDAYFVFECKRLNVQYDSGFKDGASAYVGNEGMGCFISGQYPTTCDCGGMLGYVMDGNVAAAVSAVDRALRDKRRQLRLRPPHKLAQATIMGDDGGVHQTTHGPNQHELKIYHLLLSY
jgi:hypothetical protein